ncbi:hypothetical protein BA022_04785 [Diaphorobacter nitroreducens]|nr:hypothetical protein BA022_04775 [Diaphorobacter nitroreducens]ASI67952.1 hypothetical protein BA022_04785 [Diaphorobacter nitroreducens]
MHELPIPLIASVVFKGLPVLVKGLFCNGLELAFVTPCAPLLALGCGPGCWSIAGGFACAVDVGIDTDTEEGIEADADGCGPLAGCCFKVGREP